MSESLDAACGQFEQCILGQMLRTAGVGRRDAGVQASSADDADPHSDGSVESPAGDDAFSQLVVQSLAGAIERAGGIGLRSSLVDALEDHRP